VCCSWYRCSVVVILERGVELFNCFVNKIRVIESTSGVLMK
jgi:hypothetical protein